MYREGANRQCTTSPRTGNGIHFLSHEAWSAASIACDFADVNIDVVYDKIISTCGKPEPSRWKQFIWRPISGAVTPLRCRWWDTKGYHSFRNRHMSARISEPVRMSEACGDIHPASSETAPNQALQRAVAVLAASRLPLATSIWAFRSSARLLGRAALSNWANISPLNDINSVWMSSMPHVCSGRV
jgi:hypothetical protein